MATWDQGRFFAALKRWGDSDAMSGARRLLTAVEGAYTVKDGDGTKWVTIYACIQHRGEERKLFEIHTGRTAKPKGGFVLLASYLWPVEWPESPFVRQDLRMEFIKKLNSLRLKKQVSPQAVRDRPRLALECSMMTKCSTRSWMSIGGLLSK